MNIAPSLEMEVLVQSDDDSTRKTIDQHQDVVSNLAKLKSLTVSGSGQRPKSSATAVIEGATIFVSLEGVIDFAKESERLEKEINKLDVELAKVTKKLENEAFLSKAPANVVADVKEKHAGLAEKKQKVQANLEKIKALS
jgi:valyl-tRNA synthetase